MKHKTILFIALLGLLLSSCSMRVMRGSGKITTERRDVSGFERIDVSGGMNLYLEQGKTTSVELEGDDNLLPEVVTQVIGSELRVRWEDNWFETNYRPSRAIRVYITIPDVRSVDLSGGSDLFSSQLDLESLDLEISGGGDAEIESLSASATFEVDLSGGSDMDVSQAEAERFDLNASGGGDTRIDTLNTGRVTVDISGGSDAKLAGSADICDFNTSGGSDVFARDLQCADVSVNMSGGGITETWAVDTLDVDASGGSIVRYAGQPNLNSNTSGGSKVSSLGE